MKNKSASMHCLKDYHPSIISCSYGRYGCYLNPTRSYIAANINAINLYPMIVLLKGSVMQAVDQNA